MDTHFPTLYSNGCIASWYLKDSQMAFYSMLRARADVVARCHRRFGKGTTVLTYVSERCSTEKLIVRYGAETQGQAYEITEFLLSKIYYKAPHLKPRLVNGAYHFKKTGSVIKIFGVKDSGQIDKARGTEADIIICDEYGFWKFKAEYILKSILYPQLLETNGQMIITSTPPEDLTHNYITQVMKSEATGKDFTWTIADSLRLGEKTEAEHEAIIEDCGGIDSVHYQREYMCELIPTRERLVVPEAQDESLFVGEFKRPEYCEFYVCMDLGLVDHTAVLFAYLDFLNARIVIEAEFCDNYRTTYEIVESCQGLEKELGYKKVYRRIGDCELQQLFDMSKDHDYPVSPITKRTKQSGKGFRDSVLNQLRVGIKDGKILINPKCVKTIQQLKYGIWNEKRTDFHRTDAMGHLDALMALAYLYDNIAWNRNPYPHKYEKNRSADSFIDMNEMRRRENEAAAFKGLTGRK